MSQFPNTSVMRSYSGVVGFEKHAVVKEVRVIVSTISSEVSNIIVKSLHTLPRLLNYQNVSQKSKCSETRIFV